MGRRKIAVIADTFFGCYASTMKSNLPIWSDSERLGGRPCFAGTRVPIKNLLDYVRAGESVAEFLDDFPSVSRDQVDSVLALAETLLMETVDARAA